MRDELRSKECSRALKALADPDRLRIVECLEQGAKNVSELARLLGDELANVSHHLSVLRHAGLVLDQRQGKYVFYSLHPDVYHPRDEQQSPGFLDFGCCRLVLGKT